MTAVQGQLRLTCLPLAPAGSPLPVGHACEGRFVWGPTTQPQGSQTQRNSLARVACGGLTGTDGPVGTQEAVGQEPHVRSFRPCVKLGVRLVASPHVRPRGMSCVWEVEHPVPLALHVSAWLSGDS